MITFGGTLRANSEKTVKLTKLKLKKL